MFPIKRVTRLFMAGALALALPMAYAQPGHEGHNHGPKPEKKEAPTSKPASAPVKKEKPAESATAEKKGKKDLGVEGLYPLDYCLVSGEKLGSMGPPVILMHEGREVRLCCEGCVDTFKADPAKYVKKLDAAILEQQLPSYPLEVCLASGEPIGVMDDAYTFVYKNRAFKLCCEGCSSHFNNPEEGDEMLKKVDEAAKAKQAPEYALDTCLVSGEKLGTMGDPLQFIHAGQLVQLCCEGCVDEFKKDPPKYMKRLDEAQKKKAEKEEQAMKAKAAAAGNE